MLKNPACPNFFFGKDANDYRRYRLYVLSRLPKLKFLDSSLVSDDERRQAPLVGELSIKVARPDESQVSPRATYSPHSPHRFLHEYNSSKQKRIARLRCAPSDVFCARRAVFVLRACCVRCEVRCVDFQYRKEVRSEIDNLPPLPQEVAAPAPGKASFGVATHVYVGRQSEGNRFILNSDL